MYTVTKSFKFDAAHRLQYHEGKCFNIHGHTYQLDVTISTNNVDKKGMVVDFGEMSRLMKDTVEKLDHALLVSKDDTLLRDMLSRADLVVKTFEFDEETTAENMARWLFKYIEKHVCVNVHTVAIWETPTCKAQYCRDSREVEDVSNN